MSDATGRQIAICHLLLKGEHWLPVSPDRKLSARDRSSPDGPVVVAEVIAEVEEGRITEWGDVGATYQTIHADGEVEPLDTRMAVAVIGAGLADGTASAHGVIGINRRLVERARAQQVRQLPAHLKASAMTRAETQILDRLHGFNAVGVKLIEQT